MARSAQKSSGSKLATALKYLVAAGVLGILALAVAVGIAMSSLPDYDELAQRDDLGQMIRVRATDGTLLVSMGPTFGRWLPYDDIPKTMRAAMIAVEDKRFRSHLGVDPIGIARSFKVRLESGRWRQGGSTITQQLARNIFLTNSRTFGRKVKEGVLALALERKFSKDQILELYLNRVYFGGGAYGIDAASRTFFGHGADHLSLGEAAIIAGLVKAPSNYSPTADVEAARGRASVVIASMVENGFVSPSAVIGIDPAAIRLQPPAKQNSVRYFTDWALPQLDTLIDETSEPIDVWTTLDPRMQTAADRAINANVPRGAQGALVALDRDGAVRAMVGGRDYVDSIYNRATQAERQPGSAFKLFVYLTALENGMKPTDTVVDEPVTIDGWTPRNSTRTNAGPVSLREAFSRSINTISAKIGEQFGFGTIADMARRFGLGTSISTFPSMVLGTSDVRLIDMTRAFASVSNRGVSVMPYAIRRVVTADGRMLYQHERSEERVLVAPWVAAGMTDLLPVGSAQRHRPRSADRPPRRRQDRHDQLQQGRLVHRLLERDHHGRVDGPRRCAGRRRIAGRNGACSGIPRLYDCRCCQPAGRKVRDGGSDARLATGTRRRNVGHALRREYGWAGHGRRKWNADRSAAGRPTCARRSLSFAGPAHAGPNRTRPHLQQSPAATAAGARGTA